MKAKTTPAGHGFRRPIAISGQARHLIELARRLEAARAAMLKQLPDELRTGWHLGRLDAEALVIITDSAARATRLRYSRIALLQSAEQSIGVRPAALSVKLAPPRREPPKPEAAKLTPAAAGNLLQAIQGMEDGRLRQALARLARRVKQ
jgi:hypothetical protein